MLPQIPLLNVGSDLPFQTLEREFNRINAMLDEGSGRIPMLAMKIADAVSRRWLERSDYPYLSEIDRISARIARHEPSSGPATTRQARCAMDEKEFLPIVPNSASSSKLFKKSSAKRSTAITAPQFRAIKDISGRWWVLVLQRDWILTRPNRGEGDGATEGIPNRAVSGMRSPRTRSDRAASRRRYVD
jgi:hypothetical protein